MTLIFPFLYLPFSLYSSFSLLKLLLCIALLTSLSVVSSWLQPWKPNKLFFHKREKLLWHRTTSWTVLSMMPHTDPKSLLLEVATGAVLLLSSLPPTPSGLAPSMVILLFFECCDWGSLLMIEDEVLMYQVTKLVSRIMNMG